MSHNYWACVPQLLKPVRLEPMLRNKRSYRSEKPAHRNEEYPPLTATRESLRAATKTQHSQKQTINKINKLKKKNNKKPKKTQKQTHRRRKQIYGYQRGREAGREKN